MPELLSGYLNPFPTRRPVGLRRRHLGAGTELWRIDADAPVNRDWGASLSRAIGSIRHRGISGHATPVATWRAPPASGTGPAGSSSPPTALVTISCNSSPCEILRAFDLRVQHNLDVLDLDDQMSTGQHPKVWDTCHRLVDATRIWWDDLHAASIASARSLRTASVDRRFTTRQLLAGSPRDRAEARQRTRRQP